jgi:hypothetical protein
MTSLLHLRLGRDADAACLFSCTRSLPQVFERARVSACCVCVLLAYCCGACCVIFVFVCVRRCVLLAYCWRCCVCVRVAGVSLRGAASAAFLWRSVLTADADARCGARGAWRCMAHVRKTYFFCRLLRSLMLSAIDFLFHSTCFASAPAVCMSAQFSRALCLAIHASFFAWLPWSTKVSPPRAPKCTVLSSNFAWRRLSFRLESDI